MKKRFFFNLSKKKFFRGLFESVRIGSTTRNLFRKYFFFILIFFFIDFKSLFLSLNAVGKVTSGSFVNIFGPIFEINIPISSHQRGRGDLCRNHDTWKKKENGLIFTEYLKLKTSLYLFFKKSVFGIPTRCLRQFSILTRMACNCFLFWLFFPRKAQECPSFHEIFGFSALEADRIQDFNSFCVSFDFITVIPLTGTSSFLFIFAISIWIVPEEKG